MFRTKGARRLLLLLGWAAALAVLWSRGSVLYKPGMASVGSQDFVEYWAAARLLLQGNNPYDPAALLEVEQAAGWPEPNPLLMWNPPWALALALPLALLPFELATLIWLLLQVGLVLASGALLWRFYAPGDSRFWIGMILTIPFVPGTFALIIGQISPWLLVGVTGFLCAQRSRRDLLAGASLALLMIKPHIAYLFWLAALWWALQSRRPRVLAGWLVALISASAVVLLFDPNLFTHYLTALASPPLYWATTTFGLWLRVAFGLERRWLQFLPSLLGLVGLIIWLWRRRGPWRWQNAASPLLLASVLTAAFGWSLDQLVLYPVVVDLVTRLRSSGPARWAFVLGVLAAAQAGLLILNRYQVPEAYNVWHAPVLAIIYWWVVRHEPTHGTNETEGVVT
jgi:hypothetical protein